MHPPRHYRFPALRAFYSQAYRYFWLATFFSFGTFQMQQVARSFLARDETSSPILVTAVFALGMIPMLFAPVLGGPLADGVDRKKVMVAVEVAQLSLAALTGALITIDALTIPFLMAVSFLSGVLMAVIFPVRQTLIRELTAPDAATNGLFLYSSVFSSMQIIAPAIAGVLLKFAAPRVALLCRPRRLPAGLLLRRADTGAAARSPTRRGSRSWNRRPSGSAT